MSGFLSAFQDPPIVRLFSAKASTMARNSTPTQLQLRALTSLLALVLTLLFISFPANSNAAIVVPKQERKQDSAHHSNGHSAGDDVTRGLHSSYFYIGGSYVSDGSSGEVFDGQMYVERWDPPSDCASSSYGRSSQHTQSNWFQLFRRDAHASHERARPECIKRPYPLILIHGNGQTGTNWLSTADERPGWALQFASRGYTVYVVDQPSRGRSPWNPHLHPNISSPFPFRTIEKRFTAPETFPENTWRNVSAHTQWPGEGPRRGLRGSRTFDKLYVSQVQYLSSGAEAQSLTQRAGTALLDKLGPSIVVTHSQAGAMGWLLADARPELIKALVQLEPTGPPREEAIIRSGPARRWGLTDIPLRYSPDVEVNAVDLDVVQQMRADAPGLTRCWRQRDDASSKPRRLPNLAGKEILLVTSEASYHTAYDHCTSAWLTQAGVRHEHLKLQDVGLRGNAHFMFMENNAADIEAWLDRWIQEHVNSSDHQSISNAYLPPSHSLDLRLASCEPTLPALPALLAFSFLLLSSEITSARSIASTTLLNSSTSVRTMRAA